MKTKITRKRRDQTFPKEDLFRVRLARCMWNSIYFIFLLCSWASNKALFNSLSLYSSKRKNVMIEEQPDRRHSAPETSLVVEGVRILWKAPERVTLEAKGKLLVLLPLFHCSLPAQETQVGLMGEGGSLVLLFSNVNLCKFIDQSWM